MVACDNFRQSKIQCFVKMFAANDKQWITNRTMVTNAN